MDNNLTAILTFVGAIIGASITYIVSRRESKLKYITEERQKWREEIRKIAENIESNQGNLSVELTKLKVRLNAYGMNKKKEYYLEDAHIFNIINDINKCERSYKNIKENKKILINYLSFLLKFDWERSKDEVNEDVYNLLSIILLFVGCLSYFFVFYKNIETNLEFSYVPIRKLVYILCLFGKLCLFGLYYVILFIFKLCKRKELKECQNIDFDECKIMDSKDNKKSQEYDDHLNERLKKFDCKKKKFTLLLVYLYPIVDIIFFVCLKPNKIAHIFMHVMSFFITISFLLRGYLVLKKLEREEEYNKELKSYIKKLYIE
ncbi:hypothetical protein SAMN05216520_10597 [Kandleria vitulina]|uniref:hypothetical protein n=1 Tax=Kandleria vitulina TaxID=1630 RepID=UPI00088CFC0F|nr:hypothetical protein [Kandleria vitulina]SDL42594.1 hypothetical protein SAMN05216520_10597 [Kandleria vitulina]SEI98353.1 hypothetical protein SAMN05216514_10761 [Kandleria vitulina]